MEANRRSLYQLELAAGAETLVERALQLHVSAVETLCNCNALGPGVLDNLMKALTPQRYARLLNVFFSSRAAALPSICPFQPIGRFPFGKLNDK